jgi:prophage tail gpP-like protein
MAISHKVELKLASTGTILDNWAKYSIVQDMLQPGSPFTFSLFRSDVANATWERVNDEVKAFDSVILSIDDTTQINGIIERVNPRRDRGGGCSIIISGTDISGRLQKFDASPNVSLRTATLYDAIANVLEPFGISGTQFHVGDARTVRAIQTGEANGPRAITYVTRNQRVDAVHPRVGEKAWSVIQRLAAKAGFWAWVAPDPAGNLVLVIDNPIETGDPVFFFEYAEDSPHRATEATDLLESERVIDVSQTPTDVFAVGRTARGDSSPSRSQVRQIGRFAEQWVSDNRPIQPLYIQPRCARTPATITKYAERMVRECMISHDYLMGLVQGHGQTVDGEPRIYAVNTMASWRDTIAKFEDDVVITRCEFDGGTRTKGRTTRLRAHPRGALNLTPGD